MDREKYVMSRKAFIAVGATAAFCAVTSRLESRPAFADENGKTITIYSIPGMKKRTGLDIFYVNDNDSEFNKKDTYCVDWGVPGHKGNRDFEAKTATARHDGTGDTLTSSAGHRYPPAWIHKIACASDYLVESGRLKNLFKDHGKSDEDAKIFTYLAFDYYLKHELHDNYPFYGKWMSDKDYAKALVAQFEDWYQQHKSEYVGHMVLYESGSANIQSVGLFYATKASGYLRMNKKLSG